MISAYAASLVAQPNAGLHPKVMEICRRAAAVEPEPVAGICARSSLPPSRA